MSFLDDFENLDIFTAGEFSTIATVDRQRDSATSPKDSPPEGAGASAPCRSSERLAGDSPRTSFLTELSGIFDESYQDMFGRFDGQSAESRKFCFQVQTSLIDGLKRGDRLTIKNKNYLITSLRPKHDGKLTHIILKQDFS